MGCGSSRRCPSSEPLTDFHENIDDHAGALAQDEDLNLESDDGDPRLVDGMALRRELTLMRPDADDIYTIADSNNDQLIKLQNLLLEQASLQTQLRELEARESMYLSSLNDSSAANERNEGLARENTAIRDFRRISEVGSDVESVVRSEIHALMREELLLRRHIEVLQWLLGHDPDSLSSELRTALKPHWLAGVFEGLQWAMKRATCLVDWQEDWWIFLGFSQARRRIEFRAFNDVRIGRVVLSKFTDRKDCHVPIAARKTVAMDNESVIRAGVSATNISHNKPEDVIDNDGRGDENTAEVVNADIVKADIDDREQSLGKNDTNTKAWLNIDGSDIADIRFQATDKIMTNNTDNTNLETNELDCDDESMYIRNIDMKGDSDDSDSDSDSDDDNNGDESDDPADDGDDFDSDEDDNNSDESDDSADDGDDMDDDVDDDDSDSDGDNVEGESDSDNDDDDDDMDDDEDNVCDDKIVTVSVVDTDAQDNAIVDGNDKTYDEDDNNVDEADKVDSELKDADGDNINDACMIDEESRMTLEDLQSAVCEDEPVWYRYWADGQKSQLETSICRRRVLRQDWQYWRAIRTILHSEPGAEAESVRLEESSRREEIRFLLQSLQKESASDLEKEKDSKLGLVREKTYGDGDMCAICCGEYEVGEETLRLPCFHKFHPNCVVPWLLQVGPTQGTCPLCKRHVLDDPVDPSIEQQRIIHQADALLKEHIANNDTEISHGLSSVRHLHSIRIHGCYGTIAEQTWQPLWRYYESVYADFSARFVLTSSVASLSASNFDD